MAGIIPFYGVRYNLDRVNNLTAVTTPPYDVIDTTAQERFYTQHPNNIIRLELGKKYSDDNEESNRYTRAAATFKNWLAEGILVHEDKPAIYLYQQEFKAYGQTRIRTGFIAGVQVEDYATSTVLPHEETLPKHKADRLELMRAAKANFSPIFGLFADPEHRVAEVFRTAVGQLTPDAEVTDQDGVINRMWVVTAEDALRQIIGIMGEKTIFIADGHHRYETALNFSKEMTAKGEPGYNFVMTALVNLYDEGLVVFPTHRLIRNVTGFDAVKLLDDLRQDFAVTLLDLPQNNTLTDFLNQLFAKGETAPTFGLYLGANRFYLLTLRDQQVLEQAGNPKRSAAWNHLDVAILHTLILETKLGIGSRQRADESNLTYIRDEEAAIAAVDSNEYQLCFFMNPTKVEEVTAIATGGEKMPQKSTYFYPKIITGMVINDFSR